VIDDLQFADADSLALLAHVMEPLEAPPLLLLCTLRGPDTELADDERVISARTAFLGDVRPMRVDPLPPSEAVELAALLLDRGGDQPRAPEVVRAIVDEAHGHPLFIGELARVARGGAPSDGPPPRLGDALWARVVQLDPPLGDLLKIVAVAGAPITIEVA